MSFLVNKKIDPRRAKSSQANCYPDDGLTRNFPLLPANEQDTEMAIDPGKE